MHSVKCLTLAFATLITLPAFAEREVTIESAGRFGDHTASNGCPTGSYDYTVSNDSQLIEVRFYQMDVDSLNGRNADEKNCQLTLNAQVPAGYTFAIDATEIRGHATVFDQNGTGRLEATYYADPYARFPVTLMDLPFRGPYDTDFQTSNQVPRRELQWTPCDQNPSKRIDLFTNLSVTSSGFGSSAISEHRLDRAIVQTFRLVWARCGGGGGGGGGGGAWYGDCRVVHETVWGQDLNEFWGRSQGRTQQEAVSRASQDGQIQCERARNNDAWSRCVVDQNHCTATR